LHKLALLIPRRSCPSPPLLHSHQSQRECPCPQSYTRAHPSARSSSSDADSADGYLAASTVVGFVVLAITGVLLFLKVTRVLRNGREVKRRQQVLEGCGAFGGAEGKLGWRGIKGKNAFEDKEWEGFPVSQIPLLNRLAS
jgi:hypothetical protein